ncbi:MAG: APC family permease [Verrucomicrobiia bacterium]|jgi:APA family basic amino acid/polyamine antiporter
MDINKRQLGIVSATSIVVANMIGTGVFTTSGFLLGDLKSPWRVLAVWLVGGIMATLGALCYGSLARRIPESGGEYIFLSRTLHPAAGYVAGWISLLVGFSAPLAAAAFAFGEYAKPFLLGFSPQLAGSILLFLFACVHAIDVKRGAFIQNFAVFLKVGIIAAFIIFALAKLNPTPVTVSGDFPWALFGVSLVWVSFSYSGWNAAIYIAGEIKKPEKYLPFSLILGTGIVTAIYIALNAVFVFSAPVEQLAGKLDVGRIAAQSIGGDIWANCVSAIVALVLISSVSSMIMAGPRVYAQMAADGYLPHWFIQRSGPPRTSIALQFFLALLMLWSATFDSLLTYIGFTLGISTAATVFGLVKLKIKEGSSLKVYGWPVVPFIFILAVTAMTCFSILRRPKESIFGFVTILLGLIIYKLSSNNRGNSVKLS